MHRLQHRPQARCIPSRSPVLLQLAWLCDRSRSCRLPSKCAIWARWLRRPLPSRAQGRRRHQTLAAAGAPGRERPCTELGGVVGCSLLLAGAKGARTNEVTRRSGRRVAPSGVQGSPRGGSAGDSEDGVSRPMLMVDSICNAAPDWLQIWGHGFTGTGHYILGCREMDDLDGPEELSLLPCRRCSHPRPRPASMLQQLRARNPIRRKAGCRLVLLWGARWRRKCSRWAAADRSNTKGG